MQCGTGAATSYIWNPSKRKQKIRIENARQQWLEIKPKVYNKVLAVAYLITIQIRSGALVPHDLKYI